MIESPASGRVDLQTRIRQWREDDNQGYDVAISLLWEAEDVLANATDLTPKPFSPMPLGGDLYGVGEILVRGSRKKKSAALSPPLEPADPRSELEHLAARILAWDGTFNDDAVLLAREALKLQAVLRHGQQEVARLQQEVERLATINSELCGSHNALLANAAKWQTRAQALEQEREKWRVECDRLANGLLETFEEQAGDDDGNLKPEDAVDVAFRLFDAWITRAKHAETRAQAAEQARDRLQTAIRETAEGQRREAVRQQAEADQSGETYHQGAADAYHICADELEALLASPAEAPPP